MSLWRLAAFSYTPGGIEAGQLRESRSSVQSKGIERMSKTLLHVALILATGGVVLFSNLGTPRLWDRDEPRNAGCAVEMLERQDWVTPVFNAELRTHKPILLYWMIMAAYSLFGVHEFAARFPSAVMGVGTALLTYGIGRLLISAHVGLWAALILLTTLMFDVASRAATPDAVLIFWCTAALFVYVWGIQRGSSSRPESCLDSSEPFPPRWFPTWPVAILMYACMGMAVLAKGPVGLVLPTAVIGLYLLIMRLPAGDGTRVLTGWRQRVGHAVSVFAPGHFLRTCWLMRPVTAIVVVGVVALPWYVWVGVRTDGEWLRGFFLEHNLGRATQAMEGHHGSFFYYPLALLVGFFPWSVFAVPTLLEIRQRFRRGTESNAALVLFLSWVAVYIGLFSLARTKLPSYITPCYPAVALLVSVFIDSWARNQTSVSERWIKAALICLGVVGVVGIVAVPIAAGELLPGEQWLGWIGLVPILTALLCVRAVFHQHTQKAAMQMAVGAVLTTTLVFSVAAVHISQHQQFDALLRTAKELSGDAAPQFGALAAMEPSWVFYSGRPVERLTLEDIDRLEAADRTGDENSAARSWRPKQTRPLERFLDEGPARFALTTKSYLAATGPLPPDIKVLGRANYFLKQDALLLLGRESRPAGDRNRPANRSDLATLPEGDEESVR